MMKFALLFTLISLWSLTSLAKPADVDFWGAGFNEMLEESCEEGISNTPFRISSKKIKGPKNQNTHVNFYCWRGKDYDSPGIIDFYGYSEIIINDKIAYSTPKKEELMSGHGYGRGEIIRLIAWSPVGDFLAFEAEWIALHTEPSPPKPFLYRSSDKKVFSVNLANVDHEYLKHFPKAKKYIEDRLEVSLSIEKWRSPKELSVVLYVSCAYGEECCTGGQEEESEEKKNLISCKEFEMSVPNTTHWIITPEGTVVSFLGTKK